MDKKPNLNLNHSMANVPIGPKQTKARSRTLSGYKRSVLKESINNECIYRRILPFSIHKNFLRMNRLYAIHYSDLDINNFTDVFMSLNKSFRQYFGHYTETVYKVLGTKYILRQSRCVGNKICSFCDRKKDRKLKVCVNSNCIKYKQKMPCPVTLFFLYFPIKSPAYYPDYLFFIMLVPDMGEEEHNHHLELE